MCDLVMVYDSYKIYAEFESTGIKKLIKLFVYVREMVRGGIVFIDDNSVRSKYYKSLYSAYIYLNPNYKNKTPLSIRSIEKFFRNKYEVQIKDFDDFKWDNY